jgi:uncharacterized membrane protein YccF (DUF307 family)
MITFIANVLWFVLGGGAITCIGWLCAGALLALTVIGIPFAFAAFRIAGYAAFPFGRELVDISLLGKTKTPGTDLANILWLMFAGVWLLVLHVLTGVGCCVTIIGIPFGLAHFKLAMACLGPLGMENVSTEEAQVAKRKNFNPQSPLLGRSRDSESEPGRL